ncbi:MAG: shikimate kinase [Actinomycetota bacterium]
MLGLMGVGKTTTGRALAAALGVDYLDSDADIEAATGRTGGEIADADGVPALHRLEAEVLLAALARPEPAVIGAAASVVERDHVRQALDDRARVIRLVVPPEVALARQATGAHRRPMTAEELEVLAARREPLFAAVEDLRLAADRPTAALVDEALGFLGST